MNNHRMNLENPSEKRCVHWASVSGCENTQDCSFDQRQNNRYSWFCQLESNYISCIYPVKHHQPTTMISHELREVSSEPVPGHAFLMSSCGATASAKQRNPRVDHIGRSQIMAVAPNKSLASPQVERDHFGLGMMWRIVSLVIGYTRLHPCFFWDVDLWVT